MKVFAFSSSAAFGQKIADHPGIPLSKMEERDFVDDEHKTRPLESVRNEDVFVIQSLYSEPGMSVNDKLCRLLFFIGAIKDASANHITVVAPYLCYARKDRKTKPRDPTTSRYVAQLLEAVGTERIVMMDVHNLQAYQNSFRCVPEHLEAKNLFIDYLLTQSFGKEIVIMSPDIGGMKLAEQFRESFSRRIKKELSLACMEKKRSKEVVSGETVAGDVKDKVVIILDDLINSGGTILRAVIACKRRGADSVFAMAIHGAFIAKANEALGNDAIKSIIVSNTVPILNLNESIRMKTILIDAAPLFAEAIRRIQSGGSINELLGNTEWKEKNFNKGLCAFFSCQFL